LLVQNIYAHMFKLPSNDASTHALMLLEHSFTTSGADAL
jgi:hypothetical protein